MKSLARAIIAAVIGLAGAGLAGPVVAEDEDAVYPADAQQQGPPQWERPRFTRFSALRCSPTQGAIDKLTLNRDSSSQSAGFATYTDGAKDKGYEQGAGGWALTGDRLKVSGDGFVLEGRWAGPILVATITRTAGGEPMRCRFEVSALRSFTHFQ